jgi:hypothetical protein
MRTYLFTTEPVTEIEAEAEAGLDAGAEAGLDAGADNVTSDTGPRSLGIGSLKGVD